MTQEQVDSQLSAMFDGELPAAECELLSRRIDRDENLRARWSRYALIGAAMRSEPVATARRGFAGRVSAALDAGKGKQPDRVGTSARPRVAKRTVWNTALAASMVAAVAGVSISMLRYSAPATGIATTARSRPSAAAVGMASTAAVTPVVSRILPASSSEPLSYVTPANRAAVNFGLRTQLADYIVAHSEYSTPLMRRNLLSALVSSEDGVDAPVPYASAADVGQVHATSASSSSSR